MIRRSIIPNISHRIQKPVEVEKPVHAAIKTQNRSTFLELLTEGINLEDEDAMGNRPLHIAASIESEFFTLELLKKKVNVNVLNRASHSPLMIAIKTGKRNIFRALLHSGADVNFSNRMHSTPLIEAIKFYREYEYRMLARYGADLMKMGDNGDSPLHVAVTFLNHYAFDALIKDGIPTDGRNHFGKRSLHYAITHSNNHALKILLANPSTLVKSSDLEIAIICKNNFALRNLLRKINVLTLEARRPPLIVAVKTNNLPAIRMLLEYGADINENQSGYGTALQMAIKCMNDDAFGLLIESGADLNIVGYDGDTALTCAVRATNNSAVKELLYLDVDINAVNHSKRYALHATIDSKNKYALNMLLLYDAKTDLIDLYGNTLLAYAFIGLERHMEWKECYPKIIKFSLLQKKDYQKPFFLKGSSLAMFWDCCVNEIEMMKSTILCGSNVTIFSFLRKNREESISVLNNIDVSYHISPEKCKEEFKEFEIYHDVIMHKFSISILRMEWLNKVKIIFSKSPLSHLPIGITDHICTYLNRVDLTKLISHSRAVIQEKE